MSCKAVKCVFNIDGCGGCALLGMFPEARISASGKCELYSEDRKEYERIMEEKAARGDAEDGEFPANSAN